MIKRFIPVLALTAICWLVFLVNNLMLSGHFDQYGIVPRRISSLPGILFTPFLHGSYEHLAANTLPLLILGGIICARSRGEFVLVTVAGILLGGGLTWLFARNACHIGASGLIFCYFGYLASLAWFNRTFVSLCVSILCIIGYGGIIRGVVPTSTAISWESHLAGLITGVVLAAFVARLRKAPSDRAVGTVVQP